MANTISTLSTGVKKVTLDTTGTKELMNAFGTSRIGSWRLQFVPGGATPGSVVLKTRLTGSGLTGSNWLSPIYYRDDTTTVQATGTPVTTASLVTVVCDSADLQLDYTSGADGMFVYALPIMG